MQTRWIPVTAGIAVFIAGGTATGAMAQVPPAAPTPTPSSPPRDVADVGTMPYRVWLPWASN